MRHLVYNVHAVVRRFKAPWYEHIFIADRRHYKMPSLRVVKHYGWVPQRSRVPFLCANLLVVTCFQKGHPSPLEAPVIPSR
jgi:hypothetical protein